MTYRELLKICRSLSPDLAWWLERATGEEGEQRGLGAEDRVLSAFQEIAARPGDDPGPCDPRRILASRLYADLWAIAKLLHESTPSPWCAFEDCTMDRTGQGERPDLCEEHAAWERVEKERLAAMRTDGGG